MLYVWPTGNKWSDDSGNTYAEYTDGTGSGANSLYDYRVGSDHISNANDGSIVYYIGQTVVLLDSAPAISSVTPAVPFVSAPVVNFVAPPMPTLTLYYDPLDNIYIGSDGNQYDKLRDGSGYANLNNSSWYGPVQGYNIVIGVTPPPPPGATSLTASLRLMAGVPTWFWIDYGTNSYGYWNGTNFIRLGQQQASAGFIDGVIMPAFIGGAIVAITLGAAGVGGPLLGADAAPLPVADVPPALTSPGVEINPVTGGAPIESVPLDAPPALDPAPFTGDIPVDPALQPLNPGDVQLENFLPNPDLPPSLQNTAQSVAKALPTISQAASAAKALLPIIGLTAAKASAATAAKTSGSGFTYNTALPVSGFWSNFKPYILPAAVVAAIIVTR